MARTNCTTSEAILWRHANIVDDPVYWSRVEALREELETWYARYVDEVMDGAKQAVFGRGQIGLVGSDDYAKPFADDIALQSGI